MARPAIPRGMLPIDGRLIVFRRAVARLII
jgi:hypothetical protein